MPYRRSGISGTGMGRHNEEMAEKGCKLGPHDELGRTAERTKMDESSRKITFSAQEIATYVVCPEAWRLKRLDEGKTREETERSIRSRTLRKEWVERQELSSTLKRYARVAFLLLLSLAVLVFFLEHRRLSGAQRWGSDAASQDLEPTSGARSPAGKSSRTSVEVPTEILSLLLVLGLIIFMWDLFDRRSTKLRTESGLDDRSETVSVRGSSSLPTKTFTSPSLGLTGRPDALVRENDAIVPVDLHPTATKVRDRHVVALLVHMRLLEEIEGVRPPHGLLILGKEQRQVRIKNTDEKQRWLDTLIDEMLSIAEGVPAVPAPSLYKCKSCDVRKLCAHSAYREPRPVAAPGMNGTITGGERPDDLSDD